MFEERHDGTMDGDGGRERRALISQGLGKGTRGNLMVTRNRARFSLGE
jgi:hypothetical protein